MMNAVFLAVFAMVTILNTFFAFRSKVEAFRLVSVLMAADYSVSWIIEATTQPPIRPLLQACMCAVLIFVFLRRLRIFSPSSVIRYAFPLGYSLMLLACFVYLLQHGKGALLFYGLIDAIFLALAGINLVSSIGAHARLDNMHNRGGNSVHARNMEDLESR